MDREFKSLPYFPVKAESDSGRMFKGICAVFGNIDSWGDRIMPGAFRKTVTEGRDRIKHLWQHNFSEPPTAKIIEIKEVGRDELPEEVLSYSPEATGGLMVAREYLDTPRGNEILAGLKAGTITEMSFGYDVLGSSESEENEVKIRNLTELRLYDTSDVNWGMNASTIATGAKSALPLGLLIHQLTFHAEDLKAGRRNAGSDEALLNQAHSLIVDLGCTKCMGIKEDEEEKAEAAHSTSLDLLKLKRNRLALAASQL